MLNPIIEQRWCFCNIIEITFIKRLIYLLYSFRLSEVKAVWVRRLKFRVRCPVRFCKWICSVYWFSRHCLSSSTIIFRVNDSVFSKGRSRLSWIIIERSDEPTNISFKRNFESKNSRCSSLSIRRRFSLRVRRRTNHLRSFTVKLSCKQLLSHTMKLIKSTRLLVSYRF